jgi:hypothetical protein
MSAATIHELLSSLEQSIHERFRIVNQLLASQMRPPESPLISELLARIQALEKRLDDSSRQELLPTSPMVGLEVFRKQNAPVPVAPVPVPVPVPVAPVHVPVPVAPVAAVNTEKIVHVNTDPLDTVVTTEAEIELNVDDASSIDVEEDMVAEVPDEEEAVELQEFEYKGATYYRDSDNNVFTTDEDGELNEEPFGVWNEAKQRILARR